MKKLNLKAILALTLSAVLFAALMAPASFAETAPAVDAAETAPAETARLGRNRRADLEEPENAIGRDAAIAKALAVAGITADRAGDIVVHVSENPEGAVVYRVHFTVDGQCFACEVDALTGEALCSSERNAADFGSGRGENRRSDGQGQSQGQPGSGQGMNRPNGGRRGGLRDGSCVYGTAVA